MNGGFQIAECGLKIRLLTSSAIVSTSLLLAGCAPYAQVQIDLLDQSRRGITFAKQSQTWLAAAQDQLITLQRKQLDDAFDADVREQKALDADWLIESRRAYAAAVEAIAQRQAAAKANAATAQQNLDSLDQSMQRLRYLHTVPLSWFGGSIDPVAPKSP